MVYVVLVLLGLCFGSFVNALVWRIHKQETGKTAKTKSSRAKYSIATGRSMCVDCGHTLAPNDLVPVLSWLSLRGKCRYCHKRISWQYPLVELLTAFIFVLSYIYWPSGLTGQGLFEFSLWLVFVVGFMALAVYDLRWMLLPNRIIYPLLGLALVQQLVAVIFYGQGVHYLLQVWLSILIGGGMFAFIYFVSKGKWIGFGDVRLGTLLGLLLGAPELALLMIFTSSILGTIFVIPLLLAGKAKQSTKLPYGPLLIVGAIITRLFGASLIVWYKAQVGLI